MTEAPHPGMLEHHHKPQIMSLPTELPPGPAQAEGDATAPEVSKAAMDAPLTTIVYLRQPTSLSPRQMHQQAQPNHAVMMGPDRQPPEGQT